MVLGHQVLSRSLKQICTALEREGIKGGGGGRGIQFPNASEHLLLGHDLHARGGTARNWVRDECLVGTGELIRTDQTVRK